MTANTTIAFVVTIFGCAGPLFADPIRIVDTGAVRADRNFSVDWNLGWLSAEFTTTDPRAHAPANASANQGLVVRVHR